MESPNKNGCFHGFRGGKRPLTLEPLTPRSTMLSPTARPLPPLLLFFLLLLALLGSSSPSSAMKSEVEEWLVDLKLGLLRAPLSTLGVVKLTDLTFVEEPDLEGLDLTVIQRRRFFRATKAITGSDVRVAEYDTGGGGGGGGGAGGSEPGSGGTHGGSGPPGSLDEAGDTGRGFAAEQLESLSVQAMLDYLSGSPDPSMKAQAAELEEAVRVVAAVNVDISTLTVGDIKRFQQDPDLIQQYMDTQQEAGSGDKTEAETGAGGEGAETSAETATGTGRGAGAKTDTGASGGPQQTAGTQGTRTARGPGIGDDDMRGRGVDGGEGGDTGITVGTGTVDSSGAQTSDSDGGVQVGGTTESTVLDNEGDVQEVQNIGSEVERAHASLVRTHGSAVLASFAVEAGAGGVDLSDDGEDGANLGGATGSAGSRGGGVDGGGLGGDGNHAALMSDLAAFRGALVRHKYREHDIKRRLGITEEEGFRISMWPVDPRRRQLAAYLRATQGGRGKDGGAARAAGAAGAEDSGVGGVGGGEQETFQETAHVRLPQDPPLSVLIRLFVLRMPVADEDIRAAVGGARALHRMRLLGVLRRVSGRVSPSHERRTWWFSMVQVHPVELERERKTGLEKESEKESEKEREVVFVATDFITTFLQTFEPVYYVGPDSLALIASAPHPLLLLRR